MIVYSKDDIRKAFNVIYKARGRAYGSTKFRIPVIAAFLEENVKKESTVLDAGCGRAALLKELYERDYDVSGTEICNKALVDKGEMDVKPIWYEDLGDIESNSYDVVISTEVLQHLQTEEAMREALRHLVRISKKYVVISVTEGHSRHPELRGSIRWNEMHFLDCTKIKWQRIVEEYITVDKVQDYKRSRLMMGRIKEEVAVITEALPEKKKRGRPKKQREEPVVVSPTPLIIDNPPPKEEPLIIDNPPPKEEPLIIDNPPVISDIDYALDNMAEYLDAGDEDDD